MPDICLAFEVHQPLRIDPNFSRTKTKGTRIKDLSDLYFNNAWNQEILERVAEKCYLPANRIMLENIKRYEDENEQFKVAYSISGVLLQQCKKWYPEVLESFKKLAETGHVEFLNQTYYHSLASLFPDRTEFIKQSEKHKQIVKELFDYEPVVFENTEFIYNNAIAQTLANKGYKGVFTEGASRILDWRSPNYVYQSKAADIKVLLRNYLLSDDIGFRFSDRRWPGWPLTADKYANWLSKTNGQYINIFIDYETIGEHQWPETGIYDFFSWLPGEVLRYDNLHFTTPCELIKRDPVGEIDVHDFDTISWADAARSVNAWLGNSMQRTCFQKLKELEPKVKKADNEELLEIWRRLQISDHLYYMYTTPGPSGEVHSYFSQQSPREVYEVFSAILEDFEKKVDTYLAEN